MRSRMNLMWNLTSFRRQGDQPIAIFCQLWMSIFLILISPKEIIYKNL